MKLAMLALAFTVVGCSMGDSGVQDSPPVLPPGGDVGCGLTIRIDPLLPIADPSTTVRVTASVNAFIVAPMYRWSVARDATSVAFAYAPGTDQAAIVFQASTPGVYVIGIDVMTPRGLCGATSRTINVRAPGAKVARLRLRVVPPPDVLAPPLDQPLTVDGGASADLGVVVVERGIPVALQVLGPDGGVPAYLRFSPSGARDAVVEAFADSAGQVTATLADDFHTVLVVPSLGGVPRRIIDWQAFASPNMFVVAGSAIAGTVLDPVNAGLAGATVQLSIDGVPSTVATTDGAGGFVVHAVTGGRDVTVTVTPPAASGLPRLSATSTFDLGKLVQIRYAANLGRRSLAGVRVQRAGTAVGGARLMVVGSLAAIGTVSTGTPVTASGEVRIAVTADATGTLPAALVPAAPLSAVITVAPGDLAVAALDTTTGRPAALDAPALQVIATSAHDANGGMLPRAVLDIVPTGALAMAAASPLHVIADGNGAFSAALAAGGRYDLRFADPAGRAGPRVVPDRVATTVDGAGYTLPKVLTIHGALLLGGTDPLANASVQILCSSCTGIDRAKPIAEVVSDETGQFTLAVPDPGTM